MLQKSDRRRKTRRWVKRRLERKPALQKKRPCVRNAATDQMLKRCHRDSESQCSKKRPWARNAVRGQMTPWERKRMLQKRPWARNAVTSQMLQRCQCVRESKCSEQATAREQTMLWWNRKVSRTVGNCGELWRFGKPWRFAPPTNQTVGVAHGSVYRRTTPQGSRFEPWSTLRPNSTASNSHHCHGGTPPTAETHKSTDLVATLAGRQRIALHELQSATGTWSSAPKSLQSGATSSATYMTQQQTYAAHRDGSPSPSRSICG